MSSKQDADLGRRKFFRALGAGAAAAAAATAAPLATSASAAESVEERKKTRYRETDHVKTFYRVNRYPAK